MVNSGAFRTRFDKRDYSFHRTFGGTSVLIDLEYNYDLGKTSPDQNAEGFPFGCRAYTLADIAGDEDASIYRIPYSCERIASIEGTPVIQSGDIRTAMKVGQAYGVQRLDESTQEEAETHRRGKYYSVDRIAGYDWFDSFRSALRTSGKPISVGTQWFPEWLNPQQGVLSQYFVFNSGAPWHNYKVCGEKLIEGETFLIVKPWLGKNWADKGFGYMSRTTFNRAFDVYGTVGFTQGPYTPQDIFTVKFTLLQFALSLIGRMIPFIKAYA